MFHIFTLFGKKNEHSTLEQPIIIEGETEENTNPYIGSYEGAYYDKLLSEYGKCRKLSGSIKILAVADTHSAVTEEDAEKAMTNDFDVCILLGDHSNIDIARLKHYLDNRPIYGVLGNHDCRNFYDQVGVENIMGKVITVKGLRITGFEGCPLYKKNMIGFTQEESIAVAASLPEADIMVSHCSTYRPKRPDSGVHTGLKGISEYLYRNHVPVHIFGHDHRRLDTALSNGTREICVYREQNIEL